MNETHKDALKLRLREYVESHTTKSKSGLYVCPLCGSGEKKSGTGAFSIKDGTRWKCFSCNESGDIFDLIGKIEGLTTAKAQMERAEALFSAAPSTAPAPKVKTKPQTPAPAEDYTAFLLEAHKHYKETDYLKQRGISDAVIKRFKLGYIKGYKAHNKAAWGWDAVIIPTSKESYIIRNTDGKAAGADRYRKQGKAHLFNLKALNEAAKPVFIVEGEIDALSFATAGAEAIALGSVSEQRLFIETVKERKPRQPLILALDNDEKGQAAEQSLKKELDGINGIISYRAEDIYKGCKDANELLTKDKDAFKESIAEWENIKTEAEKAAVDDYKAKSCAADLLDSFIKEIHSHTTDEYIPTGFEKLDRVLDGGLYPALYVFGAVSGMGKTTFMLQIADQIASRGKDALIFSLEMGQGELMAKSISRYTYNEAVNTGKTPKEAKTARGITTGKRYRSYTAEETAIIDSAIEKYRKAAPHIYLLEGIGETGAAEIRKAIDRHKRSTGAAPVVFVDYLQILAPENMRATDKQNIDRAIVELKRISRDYKTPVFVVSSLNRESYKESSSNKGRVTMADFKESGAVEYTADLLIALQYKGAGTQEYNPEKARKEPLRRLELVFLKNRYGTTDEKIPFDFFPAFNYYEERKY